MVAQEMLEEEGGVLKTAANLEKQARYGFEDMLLWRYRLEKKESTLCNYGRFHPRYYRSTNRREGRPGGVLSPTSQINPASGSSFPSLKPHGSPNEPDWMNLVWSPIGNLKNIDLTQIPRQSGIYKLWDQYTKQLLYIGESSNLQSRLRSHSRKNWGPFLVQTAFYASEQGMLPHQRHEVESDLLGSFYYTEKSTPVFQYINHQKVLDSF